MVAHAPSPPSRTGEPHRSPLVLRYPEGWLLIVLVPALAAGCWLGVTHRPETIDFQAWWLLPACGAVALEGVFGGWLFGDHHGLGQMAGIGAVCSWISFGLSASVTATGSVDPGGFGWPEAIVAMSAVLFVPMLLGAGAGSQLRRARTLRSSGRDWVTGEAPAVFGWLIRIVVRAAVLVIMVSLIPFAFVYSFHEFGWKGLGLPLVVAAIAVLLVTIRYRRS